MEPPKNKDVVGKMESLARKWHEGQYRKDLERTPYIEHPKAVVGQLKEWGYSEEANPAIFAIAWGHDLVEDTAVTAGKLLEACGVSGPEIVSGIAWLTFKRDNWPEAESKEKAKEMYIAHIARNAPPDILAVKLADRLCNLRDFAKLHGAGNEKVVSYYREAKPLFDNIKRLPESLRRLVSQSCKDAEWAIGIADLYEMRDAWVDEFYIVKDPPTAYGYIFEGCCKWDGDDFAASLSFEERMAWKVCKKVPRYIAEDYAKGKIKPEDIDWHSAT